MKIQSFARFGDNLPIEEACKSDRGCLAKEVLGDQKEIPMKSIFDRTSAIDAFMMLRRIASNDQDNPSKPFPRSGTYMWEEREHYDGKDWCVARYDASSEDKAWLLEKDQNYLERIERSNKLKEKEPAVWFLREKDKADKGYEVDIRKWWAAKLDEPNFEQTLAAAEEAVKQMQSQPAVGETTVMINAKQPKPESQLKATVAPVQAEADKPVAEPAKEAQSVEVKQTQAQPTVAANSPVEVKQPEVTVEKQVAPVQEQKATFMPTDSIPGVAKQSQPAPVQKTPGTYFRTDKAEYLQWSVSWGTPDIDITKARDDYKQKQQYANDIPGDGTYTWKKGEEKGKYVYGDKERDGDNYEYEVQYIPSIADKIHILYTATKHFNNNEVQRLITAESDAAKRLDLVNFRDPVTGETPLTMAVAYGNERAVELLIAAGAKIDSPNRNGFTPLHIAASSGVRVEVLQVLLKSKPRPDLDRACGEPAATPLYAAANGGHKSSVALLLAAGASIDWVDKNGMTPLYVAAYMGRKSVMKELLEHGANINLVARGGHTPLHAAAHQGHPEIIDMLLDKGANINAQNGDGETPLFLAAKNGHFEALKVLLEYGADLGLPNKKGETPLSIASRSGHKEVVKILNETKLLQQQAMTVKSGTGLSLKPVAEGSQSQNPKREMKVVPEYGEEPYYDTANIAFVRASKLMGNSDGFYYFRQNRENGESCDNPPRNFPGDGNIFIGADGNFEATKQTSSDFIKSLGERGLTDETKKYRVRYYPGTDDKLWMKEKDQNYLKRLVKDGLLKTEQPAIWYLWQSEYTTDDIGEWWAKKLQRTDLPQLLQQAQSDYDQLLKFYTAVSQGETEKLANPDVVNKFGHLSLILAAEKGDKKAVEVLLAAKAKVDSSAKNRTTPLYVAAQNGHTEVVEALLKAGAEIDLAAKDGCTPLYAAAEKGDIEMVKTLLAAGAKVDSPASDGSTPLFVAAQNGHSAVVQALLDHGASIEVTRTDGVKLTVMAGQSGHKKVVQVLRKTAEKRAAKMKTQSFGTVVGSLGASERLPVLSLRELPEVTARFEFMEKRLNALEDINETDGRALVLEMPKDGEIKWLKGKREGGDVCGVINGDHYEYEVRYNPGAKEIEWMEERDKDYLRRIKAKGKLDELQPAIALLYRLEYPSIRIRATNDIGVWWGEELARPNHLEHLRQAELVIAGKSTRLFLAAYLGKEKVVTEELSKADVHIDFRNENNATPLFAAAAHGSLEIVKALLAKGAKVDLLRNGGFTALYVAALNGHKDEVEELIKHKADINLCTTDGETPLYAAALKGHKDVVDELIKHKADVNLCTKDRMTPLYAAASGGRLDIVNALIEADADVNFANKDGVTPLWIAALGGHLEVVNALLNAGAHLNRANNTGATPLFVAVYHNKLEVVKALLKAGAKTEIAYQKETPLFAAVKNGQIEIVKALLEAGADVSFCKEDGLTPLHIAAERGDIALVNMLLAAGAKVDALSSPDGVTPLWLATKNGHIAVADLLHAKTLELSETLKTPLERKPVAMKMQRSGKMVYSTQDSDKTGKLMFVNAVLKNKEESPKYFEWAVEEYKKSRENGDIQDEKEIGKFPSTGTYTLEVTPEAVYVKYQESAEDRAWMEEKDKNYLRRIKAEGNFNKLQPAIAHLYELDYPNEEDRKANDIGAWWAEKLKRRDLPQLLEQVDLVLNKQPVLLHTFVEYGNRTLIEEAIAAGADVNARDAHGNTPLTLAARDDDKKVIEALLDNKADPNLADQTGFTPLFKVIEKNSRWLKADKVQEIIKLLLKHGAKIDGPITDPDTKELITILFTAAESGRPDVVAEMLKYGANIEFATESGRTLMHALAKASKSIDGNRIHETLKLLVDAGVSVDKPTNDGETPLFIAAQKGNLIAVKAFIDAKAQVDLGNKDGVTPLHIAAQKGHKDVLVLLLKVKADVNAVTKDGETPLHMAAQKGDRRVVELLLNAEAKVNTATKDGKTPLLLAVQNGHIDVVKELILAGADVNFAAHDGSTPLSVAEQSNHKNAEQIASLLRMAGAKEVEVKQPQQMPSELTKEAKQAELAPAKPVIEALDVEVPKPQLVASGAVMAEQAQLQPVPTESLFEAAKNGHLENVKKLIAAGAEVDAARADRVTPLYIAAQNGHLEVVKELIQAGASVNILNDKGVHLIAAAQQNEQILHELHLAQVRQEYFSRFMMHTVKAGGAPISEKRAVSEVLASSPSVADMVGFGLLTAVALTEAMRGPAPGSDLVNIVTDQGRNKRAFDNYVARRKNGDDIDSPPGQPNPPHDGTFSATATGHFVTGGAYDGVYTPGSGDVKWMEERDKNYLARIEREGRLRELQPAIWYLRERECSTKNIREWWEEKLRLPLNQAEQIQDLMAAEQPARKALALRRLPVAKLQEKLAASKQELAAIENQAAAALVACDAQEQDLFARRQQLNAKEVTPAQKSLDTLHNQFEGAVEALAYATESYAAYNVLALDPYKQEGLDRAVRTKQVFMAQKTVTGELDPEFNQFYADFDKFHQAQIQRRELLVTLEAKKWEVSQLEQALEEKKTQPKVQKVEYKQLKGLEERLTDLLAERNKLMLMVDANLKIVNSALKYGANPSLAEKKAKRAERRELLKQTLEHKNRIRAIDQELIAVRTDIAKLGVVPAETLDEKIAQYEIALKKAKAENDVQNTQMLAVISERFEAKQEFDTVNTWAEKIVISELRIPELSALQESYDAFVRNNEQRYQQIEDVISQKRFPGDLMLELINGKEDAVLQEKALLEAQIKAFVDKKGEANLTEDESKIIQKYKTYCVLAEKQWRAMKLKPEVVNYGENVQALSAELSRLKARKIEVSKKESAELKEAPANIATMGPLQVPEAKSAELPGKQEIALPAPSDGLGLMFAKDVTNEGAIAEILKSTKGARGKEFEAFLNSVFSGLHTQEDINKVTFAIAENLIKCHYNEHFLSYQWLWSADAKGRQRLGTIGGLFVIQREGDNEPKTWSENWSERLFGARKKIVYIKVGKNATPAMIFLLADAIREQKGTEYSILATYLEKLRIVYTERSDAVIIENLRGQLQRSLVLLKQLDEKNEQLQRLVVAAKTTLDEVVVKNLEQQGANTKKLKALLQETNGYIDEIKKLREALKGIESKLENVGLIAEKEKNVKELEEKLESMRKRFCEHIHETNEILFKKVADDLDNIEKIGEEALDDAEGIAARMRACAATESSLKQLESANEEAKKVFAEESAAISQDVVDGKKEINIGKEPLEQERNELKRLSSEIDAVRKRIQDIKEQLSVPKAEPVNEEEKALQAKSQAKLQDKLAEEITELDRLILIREQKTANLSLLGLDFEKVGKLHLDPIAARESTYKNAQQQQALAREAKIGELRASLKIYTEWYEKEKTRIQNAKTRRQEKLAALQADIDDLTHLIEKSIHIPALLPVAEKEKAQKQVQILKEKAKLVVQQISAFEAQEVVLKAEGEKIPTFTASIDAVTRKSKSLAEQKLPTSDAVQQLQSEARTYEYTLEEKAKLQEELTQNKEDLKAYNEYFLDRLNACGEELHQANLNVQIAEQQAAEIEGKRANVEANLTKVEEINTAAAADLKRVHDEAERKLKENEKMVQVQTEIVNKKNAEILQIKLACAAQSEKLAKILMTPESGDLAAAREELKRLKEVEDQEKAQLMKLKRDRVAAQKLVQQAKVNITKEQEEEVNKITLTAQQKLESELRGKLRVYTEWSAREQERILLAKKQREEKVVKLTAEIARLSVLMDKTLKSLPVERKEAAKEILKKLKAEVDITNAEIKKLEANTAALTASTSKLTSEVESRLIAATENLAKAASATKNGLQQIVADIEDQSAAQDLLAKSEEEHAAKVSQENQLRMAKAAQMGANSLATEADIYASMIPTVTPQKLRVILKRLKDEAKPALDALKEVAKTAEEQIDIEGKQLVQEIEDKGHAFAVVGELVGEAHTDLKQVGQKLEDVANRASVALLDSLKLVEENLQLNAATLEAVKQVSGQLKGVLGLSNEMSQLMVEMEFALTEYVAPIEFSSYEKERFILIYSELAHLQTELKDEERRKAGPLALQRPDNSTLIEETEKKINRLKLTLNQLRANSSPLARERLFGKCERILRQRTDDMRYDYINWLGPTKIFGWIAEGYRGPLYWFGIKKTESLVRYRKGLKLLAKRKELLPSAAQYDNTDYYNAMLAVETPEVKMEERKKYEKFIRTNIRIANRIVELKGKIATTRERLQELKTAAERLNFDDKDNQAKKAKMLADINLLVAELAQLEAMYSDLDAGIYAFATKITAIKPEYFQFEAEKLRNEAGMLLELTKTIEKKHTLYADRIHGMISTLQDLKAKNTALLQVNAEELRLQQNELEQQKSEDAANKVVDAEELGLVQLMEFELPKPENLPAEPVLPNAPLEVQDNAQVVVGNVEPMPAAVEPENAAPIVPIPQVAAEEKAESVVVAQAQAPSQEFKGGDLAPKYPPAHPPTQPPAQPVAVTGEENVEAPTVLDAGLAEKKP